MTWRLRRTCSSRRPHGPIWGVMQVSAQHEMQLVGSTEAGAEEWSCPQCGRRMLLRWRPRFQKLVVEPGDEWVSHSGSKGLARMGAVNVQPAEESEEVRRWLADNGIQWGDGDRAPTDR